MHSIPITNDIVWRDRYSNDTQKYKFLVERLLETDPESRAVSNEGGYQSIDDLNKRDQFQDLVALIEQQATQIHQELELVDNVKLTVINMWANINWTGHSNSFHTHLNPPSEMRIGSSSVISGVFYISVPEKSGRIGFSTTRLNYQKLGLEPSKVILPEIFLKNVDNLLLGSVKYIQPEEGDLLMFFSDMMHGVEPSRASELDRRISISFNLGLEFVK